MNLYHGSQFRIENPVHGKGRANNDYGRGFYCTEDADLAREWAVDERRDGYINCYELDMSGLVVADLNSDEYCVLHWITVLLMNRRFDLDSALSREAYRYLTSTFAPDLSAADVVKGYRADDSYFSYASDFVNGVISVSQLKKALLLGDLGEQIMLKSKKAFGSITFTGCEWVSADEWYRQKIERDKSARRAYFKMNKEDYIKGDLYMVRIIDEEVKPDDQRLR